MNDTSVQTPSRIIKGKYLIMTEAVHAMPAPVKFNKIKHKSLFLSLPKIFKIYASSIWETPTNPIQSIKFIIFATCSCISFARH